jgi:phage shock protein A
VSTPPQLSTQDAHVQQVVASVTEQVDAMARAAQNVEDINTQIQQHFQSQASAKYAASMNDWIQEYSQVTAAYQAFMENFQSGHGLINQGHEHALSIAGSFMSSDPVYSTLSPNS